MGWLRMVALPNDQQFPGRLMNATKVLALWSVTTLSLASGCRDMVGPIERTLPVPTQISKTVGAPAPRTYILGSEPGGGVYLSQYPRATWTTLVASGAVQLIAQDPLPNASAQYVYPGGGVGVTGWIDTRTDGGCILHVKISDNLPGFGPCASPGITDTLVFEANARPRAIRGPLPNSGLYECSNWHDNCHTTNIFDYSEIIEKPIPVALNKLKTTKHTATFPANGGVKFTASRTPDSIWVRNGKFAHPITVTFWQWIGADTTRLASNGYCLFPTSNLACTFYPQESGRMIVKAFTGGWEQTNSVTVQCLVSNGDSALNDYSSDYRVREELRDLLRQGNADSANTAGWNASNPRGWRRETAMVIWRLANDGGFLTVPVNDPSADACHITIPPSSYNNNNPPVPGATVYATTHAHVSNPGDELFCEGKTARMNGRRRDYAAKPSDTLDASKARRAAARQDSTNSGSDRDWNRVSERGVPTMLIAKNGFAYKLETLDVVPWFDVPLARAYRAFKGTTDAPITDAEKRCTWVPKYGA